MQLRSFFVCGAVNRSFSGGLNILDAGITRLVAPSYPFRFNFCVVLIFETSIGERGLEQDILIRFMDIDANDLFKLSSKIKIPDEPRRAIGFGVLQCNNVEIPRPGEYSLRVIINNREEGDWPITISLPKHPETET